MRNLQGVEPRVETGAVVFGGDWPGTFIRGDDAAGYAWHLETLLDELDKSAPGVVAAGVVSLAVLRGLLSDLHSSNLMRASVDISGACD